MTTAPHLKHSLKIELDDFPSGISDVKPTNQVTQIKMKKHKKRMTHMPERKTRVNFKEKLI